MLATPMLIPMRQPLVIVPALAAALLFGCGMRGSRTPAEAHAKLVAASRSKNAAQLWDALDQDTRWSWMTIQRAWRECYDITQSVVPEGSEKTRLLGRFEAAATSEDAGTLFARMLGADDWALVAALADATGAQSPQPSASGETSEIATAAGTLTYRKAHNRHWGWGFAGLAAKADQLKRTASADLERMRRDAADYERAATRGAR